MYRIIEVMDVNDQLAGVSIEIEGNNTPAAILKGGLSLMITTTHARCVDLDSQQAFLHGIVLAMSHCTITGSIPTVVDRSE